MKTRSLRKLVFTRFLLVMLAAVMAFGAPAAAFATSDANGYWTPDFNTIEDAHAYADEVNVRIMEEGIVLMKNTDDALPLADGTAITLLGTRSYDVVAGGTGASSGEGIRVTLPEALRMAGFFVNSRAEELYTSKLTPNSQAAISSGMYGGSGSSQTVETNPANLAPIEDSYGVFDTVVWTISRIGGEGSDLSRGNLPNNADPTKHYLELSDNEVATLEYLETLKAEGKINKVVVLVNSPNVLEMGLLNDSEGVDAILWIGQPGPNGLIGVGTILNGEANPSGRLVDIWNADHKLDPTWVNFGDNAQNTWNEETGAFDQTSEYAANTGAIVPGEVDSSTHVVEYEEGIYVGYKYYETAHAEALAGNYEGFVYDEQVVYPFGYGLSYTTFQQELLTAGADLEAAINAASGLDTTVDVQVKVTNTGDVAGKEVVQLYIHAPYTKGGIEKAEVALVTYGKTELLQPGESQVLTLPIRLGDVASFDYNDANANGYKGWEIEAGAYQLRLQSNSHDLISAIDMALTAKTTELDNDADAQNNAIFSNGDDFDSLINLKEAESESTMTLMTRADFKGTFPTAPTQDERVYGARLIEMMATNTTGIAGEQTNESRYDGYTNSDDDLTTDPWYMTNEDIPSTWTQAADDTARENGKTAVQLSEMAGLDYWSDEIVPEGHPYAGMTEAEAWVEFVNQLTYAELVTLVSSGRYITPGLASVGKAQANDWDGPAQIRSGGTGGYTFCTAIVVASTWNTDLAYMFGRMMGNDSLFLGVPGWYAPSMNGHRSPFTGRNFEYYSQDALQAGFIAAAVVSGYQSKGGYVYIKHFALNECETDRNGVATFVTEQAARENYFKSFEYAVKDGGAMGVMTSFNRIGVIHGAANYMSMQAMLRDEWGFKGQIVTDFYMGNMPRSGMILRAGGEIPLGSYNANGAVTGTWDASLRDGKGGVVDGYEYTAEAGGTATQYAAVRNAATRVLWVGANSNNNPNGLNLSAFAGKTVTAEANKEVEATLAVDAAALGSEDLRYTITAGQLPAGIVMDGVTGQLSGATTEIGTYNVTVSLVADGWVSTSADMTIEIAPNLTVKAGDAIDMQVGQYEVGGIIMTQGWGGMQENEITAVTRTLSDASGSLTLTDAGAVQGSFAQAGVYTVQVVEAVTYPGWWGDNVVEVVSTFTIMVTD